MRIHDRNHPMKPTTLLPQERHARILRQLTADGRVLAPELAQQMNVAEDTIRRDLRDLAAAGLCRKVYGGAVLLPVAPNGGTLSQRSTQQLDSKARLAAAAAALAAPGHILLIDAGSSNLLIAEALPAVPLTVITNAPAIAARLAERSNIELIMIGGRVNQRSGASQGLTALRELEQMRPDLYFVGACGVHAQAGVTAFDYEEAEFKRRAAAASAATAAVATAEKLGTAAPYLVLPIALLAHLIVPHDIDPAQADAFSPLGARLLRAGPEAPAHTQKDRP